MSIEVSVPLVVPAVAEKIYNLVVISELQIMGDGISEPVQARVRFDLAREVDGVWERCPIPGSERVLVVEDLYAAAGDYPALGPIIYGLRDVAAQIARDQGLL